MRGKACGLFAPVAIILGFLLAAFPAPAHHSFASLFDREKPIEITGTVTKVEWMNPHIYYYVDVKDDPGNVTNYAVEGGTPNRLYRLGWRKDSLRVGDVITVSGFRAKNRSNLLSGRIVTFPDGSRVFAASPDDGGPGPQR